MGDGQAAFVLRKEEPDAGIIEGTVVDDQTRAVAFADVTRERPRVERDSKWRRNHAPPAGDLSVRTDERGRFVMRTFEPSVTLQAAKDGRRSLPVVATAGTKTTQLRLFTAAFARFNARCPRLFVQYEYAGEAIELQLSSGSEVMVAAGVRKFLARCMVKRKLLKASMEITLAPGEYARINFDLIPMEGLHVRVVNELGAALPGVSIEAQTPLLEGTAPEVDPVSRGVATTDVTGTAVLVPTFLGSFDPLFAIELVGAWRAQKQVLARLGDEPVEVVAVPATGR